MALILNIESSTEVCSVAVARDGAVLAYREDRHEKSHSTKLTVFVQETLQEISAEITELSAVSVSEGPGSYTGLRIGVSVAKGLCYGLNIPLIAINPLKAMALGCIKKHQPDDGILFCPMMDARRMEVYTAIYDKDLQTTNDVSAMIINERSFEDMLTERKMLFFGNGADKCRSVIQSPNAVFDNDIRCSAVYMAPLANDAYVNQDFKDVAYFEPYYLKDFIATKPKSKII